MKLLISIPIELNEKLEKTKDKLMVSKPAVIRMATDSYCKKILSGVKA